MAIALVQTGKGISTSGSTVTGTWTSATTTGNLLVAYVITGQFASSLTTPAGWTSAIQQVNGSTDIGAIFYAYNATSQSSQAFSVPSGAASVVMAEYSGFGSVDPKDTTGQKHSFGSSVTCTATATTQATEVWVFGLGLQGNNPTIGTPGSSFIKEVTQLSSSGNASSMLADKIVSATGTPSCAITFTANNYIALMATFKGSTGGGGTPSGSTLALMGVG